MPNPLPRLSEHALRRQVNQTSRWTNISFIFSNSSRKYDNFFIFINSSRALYFPLCFQ